MQQVCVCRRFDHGGGLVTVYSADLESPKKRGHSSTPTTAGISVVLPRCRYPVATWLRDSSNILCTRCRIGVCQQGVAA